MSVTSLDWGQLLGQMTTPPQETYWERAIRLALDLQGILHLAQRVQEEVHQAVGETEAVITGEGMEETLLPRLRQVGKIQWALRGVLMTSSPAYHNYTHYQRI